jgi:3-isopropylmalate/(R)-2-methylmalate dehydratase large subunit
MGMTMTQKILARHAGAATLSPGDLVLCALDLVLANDITGPPAVWEFAKTGRSAVFDKDKIALVPDHFAPNKDIKSAGMCQVLRDFARAQDVRHYFEVGSMGIEHALLPEEGLIAPGEVIIGGDSHTCTYGALNAFGTGVGQTDIGASFATGTAWFRAPEAIKVELTGKLPPYVQGKDVILSLIGLIGVDGARYQSLEFSGNIGELSMDDRLTICNMAVEAGAKNGIFSCDDKTLGYLAGRVSRAYEPAEPDENACYTRTVVIDLSLLTPVTACPHLPENVKPVRDMTSIAVDQVVIGSCTNGRLDDLRQAAEVLRGRRVHERVRLIILPATQKIFLKAMEKGYIKDFIEAGAAVSTPTCGPCLGGHMGILAAGERAVATTNRNFRGRMGHVDSEVYLSGPYVAAASAVMGRLAHPEEVLGT